MQKVFFLIASCALFLSCGTQPELEWVSSTESSPWVAQERVSADNGKIAPDVEIRFDDPQQTIDGFGACFNELGWTSLNELKDEDREAIMQELFLPGVGANFTICRMPVGANDFSRDWYSYDETPGDFAMTHFSIGNDKETLIPFIKSAQRYNPNLALWASPWSPPTWMKYNKHYACAYTGEWVEAPYRNGLAEDSVGAEGSDMFIQEDAYLQAYALYFEKFIEAYRNEGIGIFAVMPQNEFNSCQIFPSCTWTAAALANFVGRYLAPAMERQNVEVMFGTMERANYLLVDTILTDPASGKYIKGVGFQWAGKDAVAEIHQRYPKLSLYQSEQECGDGLNNWSGAMYSWNLMKHYLSNGVNAYMYWNISLLEGGISRWGWAQNSLVVVDAATKSYRFTPEYYVMKHVSHYVQPGARRLNTTGTFSDLLVFENPDKSVVVIAGNEESQDKKVNIRIREEVYAPVLKANSLNTFVLK